MDENPYKAPKEIGGADHSRDIGQPSAARVEAKYSVVLIGFGISGMMLVYGHSERQLVYLSTMLLIVGVGAAYQAWRRSR